MAATAFSVDPRDLLRASLLVSGAGASCHPDLAAFGEAACHVPQLHVQTLRGASQEVESVLRGALQPLHQDSFGLADDIPGQQGLLQIALKALKGAAFINRPGRHGGVRGQDESNLLRSVVERMRNDAVGVQGSTANTENLFDDAGRGGAAVVRVRPPTSAQNGPRSCLRKWSQPRGVCPSSATRVTARRGRRGNCQARRWQQ